MQELYPIHHYLYPVHEKIPVDTWYPANCLDEPRSREVPMTPSFLQSTACYSPTHKKGTGFSFYVQCIIPTGLTFKQDHVRLSESAQLELCMQENLQVAYGESTLPNTVFRSVLRATISLVTDTDWRGFSSSDQDYSITGSANKPKSLLVVLMLVLGATSKNFLDLIAVNRD